MACEDAVPGLRNSGTMGVESVACADKVTCGAGSDFKVAGDALFPVSLGG